MSEVKFTRVNKIPDGSKRIPDNDINFILGVIQFPVRHQVNEIRLAEDALYLILESSILEMEV